MRDGGLKGITILTKGQKWPEKQGRFPGEVPKGRQEKIPLR
jgi:hypothetical protein